MISPPRYRQGSPGLGIFGSGAIRVAAWAVSASMSSAVMAFSGSAHGNKKKEKGVTSGLEIGCHRHCTGKDLSFGRQAGEIHYICMGKRILSRLHEE